MIAHFKKWKKKYVILYSQAVETKIKKLIQSRTLHVKMTDSFKK